jgi:hypothetical protein
LGGGFWQVGIRCGAQMVAIVVVFAWSFAWAFLLFGAMYLYDRNLEARFNLFYIRGKARTGVAAGGFRQKEEEDRFNAPALTGFIDPLAGDDEVELEQHITAGDLTMGQFDIGNVNAESSVSVEESPRHSLKDGRIENVEL